MGVRSFKLILNAAIWFSTFAVFIALYAYKHDLTIRDYVPNDLILNIFNSEFAFAQVAGAVLVFAAVSFLRHRYIDPRNEVRVSQFVNIVLSEISTMLFSFGSVNILIGYFLGVYVYLFIGVFLWVIGWFAHPVPNSLTGRSS